MTEWHTWDEVSAELGWSSSVNGQGCAKPTWLKDACVEGTGQPYRAVPRGYRWPFGDHRRVRRRRRTRGADSTHTLAALSCY